MADPMKIRAKMTGEIAEVKVLIGHPMETGQRKDPTGKLIPAHFIQSLIVSVGGRNVVTAQTSTSISRNPAFTFKVKGAKVGEKVVINWVDNKGETQTNEATIA